MGTYVLDGVALDDPAGRWAVSDKTLLGPLPAPALSAVTIPGVHGSAPVPPTVRGPGSHTVGLIVTDNDAAGKPGGHQQMRANVAALWAIAAPLGRLPDLRYYAAPDAPTWRAAAVRLLAAVEPEMHDPYTAEVVLPFDLPGVFWRESNEQTIAVGQGGIVAELDGTTGSITDPVLRFPGPVTDVRATDTATGKTLRWSGNVPAGSFLRIEPATYTARVTTTSAWTGGADVSGGLSVGPGGFDLNPNAQQRVALTITGAPGANQIRARRAFL
ncbi:hypothetical protein NYO98_10425 [Nocardioides sp. STR2]|uniref:Phage tail protein n=1 Tax=Nocardioides pini TaxID=2975053 RepID=A0ABT4CCL4_9ACTN|nr:hypothetical protein [Nocardioides pini]MCY4726693.1 hypothetical protein [Nocardioides pini]